MPFTEEVRLSVFVLSLDTYSLNLWSEEIGMEDLHGDTSISLAVLRFHNHHQWKAMIPIMILSYEN